MRAPSYRSTRRRFLASLPVSAACIAAIPRPLRALEDAGSPVDSKLTAANPELVKRIAAIMSEPPYKHAHWGLLAVEKTSGKAVAELNADKLFAPASTTKLYSVAAALDAFGADHKFDTLVRRRGKVDSNGQLLGDLILVASGDFTLGGRTMPDGTIAFKNFDHTYANDNPACDITEPDPLAGLNALAKQVRDSGITRVRGNVLIDDRLFESNTGSGSGPQRLTPIMVNDNVIDVLIRASQVGKPARLDWRPRTTLFQVDGEIATAKPDTRMQVDISDSKGRLTLRGEVPMRERPFVQVWEVPNASVFARSLFIAALKRAGVQVDGGGKSESKQLPPVQELKKLPQVAEFRSPPFSEAIKLILKVSHNLHASTLPLLLAASHGKRRLPEGIELQAEFFRKAGVDLDAISFGGGAGGARGDFTAPRATVQLLQHMARHKHADAYRRALPIIGVDGTLAEVVTKDSPAYSRVHAKTGTFYAPNFLNDSMLLTSKALAGYLTTVQGKELIFALFVNGTQLRSLSETSREGKTLGRICEVLCTHV